MLSAKSLVYAAHIQMTKISNVIAIFSTEETHLSLTNRATHLEVSQGHQTWYHMLGMVSC